MPADAQPPDSNCVIRYRPSYTIYTCVLRCRQAYNVIRRSLSVVLSVFMRVCFFVSYCLSVGLCLSVSLSVSVCLYVCMSVSLSACLSVCLMCVSLHFCLSVCMYVVVIVNFIHLEHLKANRRAPVYSRAQPVSPSVSLTVYVCVFVRSSVSVCLLKLHLSSYIYHLRGFAVGEDH